MDLNSNTLVYRQIITLMTQLQEELPIAFYPQHPNQSDSLQDINLIST